MESKSRKWLFVVLTPFQYICALEYIYKFELERTSCDLVLVSHFQKSIDQIKEIGHFERFNNVCSPMVGKRNLWLRLFNTYRILNRKKHYIPVLGNINNAWCSYMLQISYASKNVILLDDGTATVPVVEARNNGDFHIKVPVSKSKMSLFNQLILRLKNYYSDPLNFFTIFHTLTSEVDKITVNNLDFLRSNNHSNHASIVDEAWFIGTPLVQLGAVSKDYYSKMLKIVSNQCESEGLVLKYFAHRVEKLEELPKMDVIFNEMPFELYYINSRNKPKYIYSFYSTSLVVLSKMEAASGLIALKLGKSDRVQPKREYWEHVDAIYELLAKDERIKVISHNN